MNMYNQCLVMWEDASGVQATSFWTTIDQADTVPAALTSLATLAGALSNAKVLGVQYQATSIIGGSASSSDYASINDRAVLAARIAETGQPTRFEIPAPKQSIFLADNLTVDFTNASVVAFVAAVQAQLGDRNNHPVGSFTAGKRQRARGN